jgi:hypothetical protein
MGVELPNQNVYDVGATAIVIEPAMFGTDSTSPLGAGYGMRMDHESSETMGPDGEDID